jgi:hypothetical protein
VRFQANWRLSLAADGWFGGGLPVELDTGDVDFTLPLAQTADLF